MREPANTKQIFLRVDEETDALITALSKRRRVKRNAWLRDAINLAIDLENGTQQ